MRRLTSIVAAIGVFATGVAGVSARQRPPPVVTHGPFEIVLETRRIGAGGFPNTTMNPFRKTEVSDFVVRYQGKPVTVPAANGTGAVSRFWRVMRLPDAPQHALLAATSQLYLITEDAGALRVQRLAGESNDTVSLQWLDSNDGQPGAETRIGVAQLTQEDTALQGGRWLLIGRTAVLDVRTLKSFPVRPWVARGNGHADEGFSASTVVLARRNPIRDAQSRTSRRRGRAHHRRHRHRQR